MGTKQNPGAFDCYKAALPDEPMFVLLARDPYAPSLIDDWAAQRATMINRGLRPESDRAMVNEAYQLAYEMRKWRQMNEGKWRSSPVSGNATTGADQDIDHDAGPDA